MLSSSAVVWSARRWAWRWRRHGLGSVIVDPADPVVTLAPGFDGRASAVASASGRMLDAIGVAKRLAGQGCAIRQIRVSDGLAPGALDFIPDDDDDALGVMYENKALRRALFDAAGEAPLVDLRMKTRALAVERGPAGVTATLDDGSTVRAPLLIAAEGRNSPTRAAAGRDGDEKNSGAGGTHGSSHAIKDRPVGFKPAEQLPHWRPRAQRRVPDRWPARLPRRALSAPRSRCRLARRSRDSMRAG